MAMKIDILENDVEHQPINAALSRTGRSCKAKWNFNPDVVNGFIIAVFPVADSDSINFDDMTDTVKSLLTNSGFSPVAYESEKCNIRILPKNAYDNQGIDIGELTTFGQAMLVQVMTYSKDKDEYRVYWKHSVEKNLLIPYEIGYKIDVKKKLFKPAVTVLHIDKMSNYKDGMIYYSIDGSNVKYPVTDRMLGKDLYIDIEKDMNVNVRVKDEYASYCTLVLR